MAIDFLLAVFKEREQAEAIIWEDRVYTYAWLLERFAYWQQRIEAEHIKPGTVVIVEADFSPNAVALFLALADRNCILVPLTASLAAKRATFIAIAEGEVTVGVDQADVVTIAHLDSRAKHPLYKQLRRSGHAGLVLFSSGSTGESKAGVHDLVRLLDKFRVPRQGLRTVSFLLYDHIGGVNTMLYTLSNGGCLVTIRERSPDEVLAAISKYHVELLPTSPTFINLILLSEAYRRHDLSSLKTVTYGTESMPESTLQRFNQLFPHIKLQQTYGLSEIGIMRSRSKASNSLWVRLGGEGFQTRVVDGILHIKAASAMLGYLNAPSPFTDDGWFNTGDAVETDGEFMKILGRRSELINVGGEKVYPAEVESVIGELESVADVTVLGESNAIMGSIVCAKILPASTLDEMQKKALAADIKRYCGERLERYKVPVKISFTDDHALGPRLKKTRKLS
ncbi:MAG TPA: fatty acid--CoA ligase family protein [Pyrinomonadaceae bacterium]|jgi:acyl-CoA synthetase (AMP-forming)/AMP-acid ligase II|nr:fatty acid--CoA ligase family protein [Pyrinomonadaceae bacterium]